MVSLRNLPSFRCRVRTTRKTAQFQLSIGAVSSGVVERRHTHRSRPLLKRAMSLTCRDFAQLAHVVRKSALVDPNADLPSPVSPGTTPGFFCTARPGIPQGNSPDALRDDIRFCRCEENAVTKQPRGTRSPTRQTNRRIRRSRGHCRCPSARRRACVWSPRPIPACRARKTCPEALQACADWKARLS